MGVKSCIHTNPGNLVNFIFMLPQSFHISFKIHFKNYSKYEARMKNRRVIKK